MSLYWHLTGGKSDKNDNNNMKLFWGNIKQKMMLAVNFSEI